MNFSIFRKLCVLFFFTVSLNLFSDGGGKKMFASDVELYSYLLKSCAPFEGDIAENFSSDDYKIVQKWPEELQRKMITYNQQRKFKFDEKLAQSITSEQVEKLIATLRPEEKLVFNFMLPSDKLMMVQSRIDFANNSKIRPKNDAVVQKQTPVAEDFVEKIPDEELAMLKKCDADFRRLEASRAERIATAEAYLEKYPNSPIRASIYFNMGMIYTQRSNPKEEWDRKKADIYYRKAHEIWGEKYSYEHVLAWSSLCNRSYGNVDERIAYLSFLYKVENANSIDIFDNNRGFNSVVRYPYFRITKDLLENKLVGLKEEVAPFLSTATSNIIVRSEKNPEDLKKIIAAFPGKPIAAEAQKILGIEVDEVLEEVVNPTVVPEVIKEEVKKNHLNTTLTFIFVTLLVVFFFAAIILYLRKGK